MYAAWRARKAGFRSESRMPKYATLFLMPSIAAPAGLPSMSTTATNLTPVLVSQPYMARRSSMACNRPKS